LRSLHGDFLNLGQADSFVLNVLQSFEHFQIFTFHNFLLILNVVGFEGRQRALLALSGEDWLQVQRRSRILELSEVGLHLEVN